MTGLVEAVSTVGRISWLEGRRVRSLGSRRPRLSAGPESGSAAVSSGLAEFSSELEGVEGASSTRTAFGAQATKAMERRKMVGFIRLGRGI